jgi:transcriptional regulator with XRE-family HTH domain
MNTIGNRIARLLELNNISQADLSRKLNIAQSSISNIVNSKVEPKSSTLTIIVKYFKCNATWLLTGSGEVYADSEIQKYQKELRRKTDEIVKLQKKLLDQYDIENDKKTE